MVVASTMVDRKRSTWMKVVSSGWRLAEEKGQHCKKHGVIEK